MYLCIKGSHSFISNKQHYNFDCYFIDSYTPGMRYYLEEGKVKESPIIEKNIPKDETVKSVVAEVVNKV